ncbi:MAG: metallophosphoesterase [Planctomycetota bacterium]|jgi:predicted MPP superfamily phosphohydrolase
MVRQSKSRRITRRGFLRLTGGGMIGGIAATAIDALVIEPWWIDVSRPVVHLANLPVAWDGVRIAHLTDLHVGKLVPLDHARKAVDLANAASPDLIVLTGDFVSRRAAVTDKLAEALAALQAPLGVFGVLGNHDHWVGAPAVRGMLRAAGVALIDNRRAVLTRKAAPLVIAGVGDLWTDRKDLPGALAGTPADAPRILLCHNPDYADQMPAAPRVDLMLCGHTHGGQVKIPFGSRPRLPVKNLRYGAGLISGPQCPLYVSRGIGMVGIPLRFNCRPELPIITLRKAGQT